MGVLNRQQITIIECLDQIIQAAGKLLESAALCGVGGLLSGYFLESTQMAILFALERIDN